MSKRRLIVLALTLIASLVTSVGSPASAAAVWAPADSAPIHPGVQLVTSGAQCTANFVFFDASDVYIGQAAHCSSRDEATQTNGCEANVLPLGTSVSVGGASRPGTLAYNSWNAMHAANEQDADTCFGNDFALVKLDAADRGNVNPSIPLWGGPQGIAGGSSLGDVVYSYGNSGLRGGLALLSPKIGLGIGQMTSDWQHDVYTVTPGIPGDSGSAFLGPDGAALGVLSTIEVLPAPASNNVSDLARALAYMYAHTTLDGVQLAAGTVRFSPLPLARLATLL